jgi:hypothetical protein
MLLLYPLLQRTQKGGDHVKAVVFDQVLTGTLMLGLVLPSQGRQVGQLVPVDLGDFLPRLRLEVRVHGHATENVEHHGLFTHSDSDLFHVLVGLDQVGGPQVVARLLPDLSHGAVEIGLFLVDLASGETPFGALLPSLDEHGVGHVLVEHNGAAHGHACLVGEELLVGLLVQLLRVGGK